MAQYRRYDEYCYYNMPSLRTELLRSNDAEIGYKEDYKRQFE